MYHINCIHSFLVIYSMLSIIILYNIYIGYVILATGQGAVSFEEDAPPLIVPDELRRQLRSLLTLQLGPNQVEIARDEPQIDLKQAETSTETEHLHAFTTAKALVGLREVPIWKWRRLFPACKALQTSTRKGFGLLGGPRQLFSGMSEITYFT